MGRGAQQLLLLLQLSLLLLTQLLPHLLLLRLLSFQSSIRRSLRQTRAENENGAKH